MVRLYCQSVMVNMVFADIMIQREAIMTDIQILILAGFMFIGLPLGILGGAAILAFIDKKRRP